MDLETSSPLITTSSSSKEIRVNPKQGICVKKCCHVLIGVISLYLLLVMYICSAITVWSQRKPQIVYVPPVDESLSNQTVPSGFLVWSPQCQIPDFEPLAADVMRFFKKENYEDCSTVKPLTRIARTTSTDVVYLILDEGNKIKNINCCYQEIIRSGTGKEADNNFYFGRCFEFDRSIKLPPKIEYIFVQCKSAGKIIYTNTHAVVRDRLEIRKKLDQNKERDKKRPLSVLMIAIDSVSRLNFIRAMPMTAQHVYDTTGWFELQGYNKIDDNTYPNLMAILVGYNRTLAYDVCQPTVPGKLEACPFLWKEFRDAGYVTAYGEDETSISSFNYLKTGFLLPPTDFYLRPYMLAAERNLKTKYKHALKLCLGYKHTADHVYDYALDFATTYKNDPSFGLFWTNSFSHNDISDPSLMDTKIKSYLTELEARGIMNKSMVVFFSDHGMRFGPVRNLQTGWLEERLPFIFIWLPEWFKKEHPEIVKALKINRNRLTNPYDLHMTLKHVLELSERVTKLPPAASCILCQSLFIEMPWNRSCQSSAITEHWCTCTPYKTNDKNADVVSKGVEFVIDLINRELNKFANGLCAELKLEKILYARRAQYLEDHGSDDVFMIVFEASPSGGMFEATVKYTLKTRKFGLTGSISRLNMYSGQSSCIKNIELKKYCYCRTYITRRMI